MEIFDKTTVQNLLGVGLVVLAFLAAMAPSATANDKPTQPAEQVAVIAHLSLPGAPVQQMFVQQQDSKQYLYIQQASKEGFTIVDVTKPARPGVIKRGAFPNTASSGKLQMVGNGLALAEAPDEGPGSANARHELVPTKGQGNGNGGQPAESVRVLDLSDPANPKTLQTFDGVTSVLADDGRRLIYITNGDGLWCSSGGRFPCVIRNPSFRPSRTVNEGGAHEIRAGFPAKHGCEPAVRGCIDHLRNLLTVRKDAMKKHLMLFVLVSGVLSVCTQAANRREYQSAMVVSVRDHETPSYNAGDNPSDAPLQAEVHSYDIGIRLNCAVYTVRYDSAFDYLPPVFVPNNKIDVNPHKHVMYLSLPGNREVRMGIGSRSRVKDASCMANN